jgi:hypothetical protein
VEDAAMIRDDRAARCMKEKGPHEKGISRVRHTDVFVALRAMIPDLILVETTKAV